MSNLAEVRDALCRQKFDAFAERAFQAVYPGVKFEYNWHLGCISEHLEAVYNLELQNLIINVPFRTLKSFWVTTVFPAWVMGKHAHERFICASYSSSLSLRHSLDGRRIMESEWYKSVFDTRLDPAQNQKHKYYTTENGMRYATSVLGTVTGEGGNYLILDDPIKPGDAWSDTIRKTTNERLDDTFVNRYVDPRTFRKILVMQRLHEQDPTGHFLEKGGYHHLKLPGEAKSQVLVSLKGKDWKMEQGDLLHPERLTRDILNDLRRDMGEYAYAGQVLQEPVPIGGGEFKEDWIQYFDPVETGNYKQYNVYILVDAAGKGKDWTAMMVVGLGPDNNYYLLDIVRDHLNPTERVNKVFDLHRKWNSLCGKPPTVGYEAYGMMTDTHYIEQKQKADGYRFPLIELKGNEKDRKNQDIRRLIPDMQTGRWYFPLNLLYTVNIEGRPVVFDLVKELVKSEMLTFPVAKFDDMLDALSRIYDEELGAVFPMLRRRTEYEKQILKPGTPGDGAEGWLGY